MLRITAKNLYTIKNPGYYEKTAIRKRPGTVGICAALMNRYKIEAGVPPFDLRRIYKGGYRKCID
ncbi:MAG: hypothetical protein IPG87_13005 [Saprospiraceae bacterium]|nr:hypothetical protein [Candidatus Vicinibacter affinis]